MANLASGVSGADKPKARGTVDEGTRTEGSEKKR
jgi:hypothetical protein